MMLARATARQREIGIRLSLGALRRRLTRQLLTESILLSIPAAILGFIISRVTIDASIRLMFATVPKDMLELIHDAPRPVDWRVMAFMVFAALASALLFGLAPALQATRANVMSSVRGEVTSDLRPVRVRNALVIAQITVCTLLLDACGALVRTTMAMSAFDIGFRTNNVIANGWPGVGLLLQRMLTAILLVRFGIIELADKSFSPSMIPQMIAACAGILLPNLAPRVRGTSPRSLR